MGFIADTVIESPSLGPLFAEYETLELVLENVRVDDQDGEERTVNFYFWVSGVDPDTFEVAVETLDDFSVVKRTTSVADRHLFRLTMPQDRRDNTPYSVLSGHDITVLSYRITDGEGELKARYPDRNALSAMREWFTERDFTFRLKRIYAEQPTGSVYNVTEKQREALVEAWNAGFYDTPRQATLQEIAAELGITQQSLSQRMKRGLEALLAETLVPGKDEKDPADESVNK